MNTNTFFLRSLVLPTFVVAGSAMLFGAENAFIDYTGTTSGLPANVLRQSSGLGLVVDSNSTGQVSGDWKLTFNGTPYDVLDGVIIPQAYPTFGSDHINLTVTAGRAFIEVPGRFTEVNPVAGYANGWLSLTDITGGGTEANFDLGFVYFPKSEGWISGTVSINGVIQNGNTTGVTVVKDFDDPGRFTLSIAGENSLTSGMLFVVGGDNNTSGNVVSTETRPDGTGWDIISYDQGATFADINDGDNEGDGGEDGTFHFAYVPYSTPNLIGGRIDDNGTILAGTPGFLSSVLGTPNPAGRYLLQIPDPLGGFYDDSDGLIIATPSKGASLTGLPAVDPDDNFLEVLYNPGLQGWEVRSFDLSGAGAQTTEFVFAFSRYDAPIAVAVPEPSAVLALLAGGGMLFARRRRVGA